MWLADRTMVALRRALPRPKVATRRMRGGYRMELHPNDDPHERDLYDTGTYEPATLGLFDAVLRPGDTMVDVGANLGLMSLHAASRVGRSGRVVCLEPHPGHFRRLARNIALNPSPAILALEVAAGARTERRTIHDVPSVGIGRSSLVLPDAASVPAGTVEVVPLDDLLDRHGIGSVRLLKIDVEGFEAEVLRGAIRTLRRKPIVCMEVNAAVRGEDEPPLVAHDLLMGSGDYTSHLFLRSKSRESPLINVEDRERLASQLFDNVIYIPADLRRALPDRLFASQTGSAARR